MKYVVLFARIALGAIFVYASLYKIIEPESFAQSIRNYQLLPPATTNLVAITLPWLELIAGGLLIAGIQTKPAALIVTSMLVAFMIGLFRAYWIGLDIDCGCFTSAANSSGRITELTLLRDSSLVLVGLFVLLADRGDFSLQPRWTAPAEEGRAI